MSTISTPLVPLTSPHAIFEPAVWRSVLRCFNEVDALKLATMYGNQQRVWVIRNLVKDIPCVRTWENAVADENIPMLNYLMDYKIPCPDICELAQFAADNGLDRVLIFLLTPEHVFYNERGKKINKSRIPFLDAACRENRVHMVKGVCAFVQTKQPKKLANILQHTATLHHVVSHNLIDIARVIVPTVYPVVPAEVVAVAAASGFTQMYEMCVQFSDRATLVSAVIPAVSQKGHMDIIRLINIEDLASATAMLEQAFACGQREVVEYVITRHPTILPTQASVLEACTNGHLSCIAMLPKTSELPSNSLRAAISSRSSGLIVHVANLFSTQYPKFKYDESLLKAAIKSGCSTNVMLVFEIGQYKEIGKDIPSLLVRNKCREALLGFHELGFTVYCDSSFKTAVETCNVDILNDLLERYEPRHESLQDVIPSGSKDDVRAVLDMINNRTNGPKIKRSRN